MAGLEFQVSELEPICVLSHVTTYYLLAYLLTYLLTYYFLLLRMTTDLHFVRPYDDYRLVSRPPRGLTEANAMGIIRPTE